MSNIINSVTKSASENTQAGNELPSSLPPTPILWLPPCQGVQVIPGMWIESAETHGYWDTTVLSHLQEQAISLHMSTSHVQSPPAPLIPNWETRAARAQKMIRKAACLYHKMDNS